jgi:hypothetical protein
MKMKRPMALLVIFAISAWLLGSAAEVGAQIKPIDSKMRLEYLMTFHVDLTQPLVIGKVASGQMLVMVASGGTFDGPKLQGKCLPGPVDWLVQGSDGVGRMDVRGTFQTQDGANIYIRYQGVQVWTEAAGAKLSKGTPIEYGEIYWVGAPVFETGDPHYAWLNNIVTVAEGRLGPGGSWVEYRVFQVVD